MGLFKILRLAVLFLLISGPVFGQDMLHNQDIDSLFKDSGEIYFRFQVEDKAVINQFSRIVSIDKAQADGTVHAYANRKELSHFLEHSIPYEILPHPGFYAGDLNMKEQIDIREPLEWDFYPTYQAYVDMMYQFAAQYPSLCQVFSIGTTNLGRELLIARISDNIGIHENEPQFLYTSSMHGDETAGYVLMLRLIDYLLSNYGTDPRVTSLVDNIEIWINPLANPDGTYWGGNHTVNNAKRYNSEGVDLNRNYPDPKAGPHPDGNEWQVETVAFMGMAEDHHFVSSANIHGGAEVCNYPWDTWSHLAADNDWWVYVCREYADTAHLYSPSGYMSGFDNGITNGYAWYSITGGRQDYMNYFQQCREFTLEISNAKILPPQQLPAWWNYNYRSLLNYMEQSVFGLRGIVRDSVTGWPIRAEVYALSHEADSSWVYSSLPTGKYHRLLPAGNYSVRYAAPGYATKVIHNVNVANRQATYLDVLLVPGGGGVGSVDQYLVSQHIKIHPNPVKGHMMKYESEYLIESVCLYDVSGKTLAEWSEGKMEGHLDLGSVTNGFYYLRFITTEGWGVKKLVIDR